MKSGNFINRADVLEKMPKNFSITVLKYQFLRRWGGGKLRRNTLVRIYVQEFNTKSLPFRIHRSPRSGMISKSH